MQVRPRLLLIFLAILVSRSAPATAGFETDFSAIDSRLGLALRPLLQEVFEKENPNANDHPATGVQYKAVPTRFAGTDGERDTLVIAKVQTGWAKTDTTVILGFTESDGTDALVFRWAGWNKNFGMEPHLIDIDGDGGMELLLETDDSGNQATRSRVSIWKYAPGGMRLVFREGLEETLGTFPYAYTNRYVLEPNGERPDQQDILLHVDGGGGGYPRIRETVRFVYDAEKGAYHPQTPIPDYRKPFTEQEPR